METIYITNVGLMISGDWRNPILAADTLIIQDGLISQIGKAETLKPPEGAAIIDANGSAVTPGLIDSHCHSVLGDFTPGN